MDGKLISWKSKKQTCVSLSTAEAEYIAAAASTSQMIWIQSQLLDYYTTKSTKMNDFLTHT